MPEWVQVGSDSCNSEWVATAILLEAGRINASTTLSSLLPNPAGTSNWPNLNQKQEKSGACGWSTYKLASRDTKQGGQGQGVDLENKTGTITTVMMQV